MDLAQRGPTDALLQIARFLRIQIIPNGLPQRVSASGEVERLLRRTTSQFDGPQKGVTWYSQKWDSTVS